MKRDQLNYFVVGSLVLCLGAIFIAILFKLTGRRGAMDPYSVVYANVNGLKYGTGVFYQGFQVGQVEAIVPEREGNRTRYRLTLGVAKDWPIPKDSVARIESSGLISAVFINIEEGHAPEVLQPGEEIHGRDRVDIMSVLGSVASDLHDLSENGLKPVLVNFNKRLDEVGKQIEGLDIKGFMGKLDHSAVQLQTVLRDENVQHVDHMLDQLDGASVKVNRLATELEDTRSRANGVINEAHELISKNRDGVNASVLLVKSSAANLEKTIHTVAENIDDIVYHVNDSSRNLHEFTRQIRENPGVLIHGTQPAATPAAVTTGKGKP
jgi:phospholipid/cholesterol/gamma-HCH transport system substrate-binding protein